MEVLYETELWLQYGKQNLSETENYKQYKRYTSAIPKFRYP